MCLDHGKQAQEALPSKAHQHIVEDVIWASEGRAFFVSTGGGRVRKIAVDSFEVLNEKSLGAKCGVMKVTSEGLVAVAAERRCS